MSNGTLDMQPFEVDDFSGGMTDFYLQGDRKRFQKADNFLVSVDKGLELRFGSVGFDTLGNHKMPGDSRRVDAFVPFDEDLLVNQGRDIYYRSPTWTALTGPSGNPALFHGESFHQIAQKEWKGKGHVYLTSDAGSLPTKIYRDTTGAYQVRTVGLPLPVSTPRYTDSSLLGACILLANDLRASMMSHMHDYSNTNPNAGPVANYLHGRLDKYSLSYFEVQTFDILTDPEALPEPLPTPAPAATDEDSLYALCTALAAAYTHHAFDPEDELYHFDLDVSDGDLETIPPKGPYSPVAGNTTPSTLEDAAAILDELRTKWHWHRLGLFSHTALNDYDSMNKYPVTVPPVGEIDLEGAPRVTPNFDDFIRFANYLKNAYNQHVTNGEFGADFAAGVATDFHTQAQNDLQYTAITIADALDVDTAKLIIYWAWALYGALHVVDGNVAAHPLFTMTTVAGSANVTAVADSAAAALTLPEGCWIYATNSLFAGAAPHIAQVVTSGSGTATLSKTLLNSNSNVEGQYSFSVYHGAFLNGDLVDETAFAAGTAEFLDPQPSPGLADNQSLPTSIEEWVALGLSVFAALQTHMANAVSHATPDGLDSYLQGNGPFFAPETESVAYAFTFKSEYTVQGGQTFLVISEPLTIGPFETGKIYPPGTALPSGITGVPDGVVEATASVEITNLPELVNTSQTNYSTSDALVQVYRTIDGGSTFYLLDEVDNGTDSFTDDTADSLSSAGNPALDTREELYTTGGILPNVQPPVCRFLHILNNTAYYGDVVDDGQRFKNRIVQSIPGTPDGAPGDSFDDLDDDLEGISSARKVLVALCTSNIYRMEGGFSEIGQGTLTHDSISDKMGCVSGASIVQTEVGLFFAGTDGFYYTDGFQIIKISIDLDLTYARYTKTAAQKRAIQGSYDTDTRRIWWTMQSELSSGGCDLTFVYHLNFGVKPSGVFTTTSGGANYRPSSLAFWDGAMIRGDERGLLFRHEAIYLSDPEVPTDLDTALASWNTAHIPYDYRSCALDFGSLYKGQWVTKVHMVGENLGNVAAQFYSVADNINDTRGKKPVAPIFYQDNLLWGDPTLNWGDDECLWRYDGKVDYWRRFAAGNLRSQLKQIQLQPAVVGVYRSDAYAGAQVLLERTGVGTADITLQDFDVYTSLTFPLDVVGMVIALSFDDYETELTIATVAAGVLTVTGDDTFLQTYDDIEGSWVIRGYLKEGSLSLLSYCLTFAQTGNRGRAYGGSSDRGENAAS